MNRLITYTVSILIFLWSVCTLPFLADPTNLTLGTFSVILLLLLEISAIAVMFLNFKNVMSSKLNIAVIIWAIYAILNAIVNSEDLFLDCREILWWPLIYFLFYFIAFNDFQDKYVRSIIKLFTILFVVLLIQYLSIRSTNFFKYSASGKMLFESSNAIYFNALLLPLSFLLKKKYSKYILLISGLILVLLSFKRSPLIYTVLVIAIAIYYDFIWVKKSNLMNGILISCIIIIVGFFAFRYVDNKTDGFITKRFELMKVDQGSGRTEIYKNVWKIYNEKNIESKLIGSGHNHVIVDNKIRYKKGDIEHISAHNDFLEILYDFGIIGLVIYLNLIVLLVRRLFYLKSIDDRFYQANIAAMIIFLSMSMVSHLIIYPTYFAYLVILWAITEGIIKRKEIQIGKE